MAGGAAASRVRAPSVSWRTRSAKAEAAEAEFAGVVNPAFGLREQGGVAEPGL